MSDLFTTAQDSYRDACISALVGLMSARDTMVERAKDARGQTAAEYMGVLLLVALIIVAVVGTHIDTKIADAVTGAVEKITKSTDCKKDC
jgi:Flp pilus assembly pilin Flp